MFLLCRIVSLVLSLCCCSSSFSSSSSSSLSHFFPFVVFRQYLSLVPPLNPLYCLAALQAAVVVVGAGVHGSSAALHLARAGQDTILLEQVSVR